MTDLTGKQIANTYKQLLKVAVSTNSGVSTTAQTIQSGDGTNSAMQLSTTAIKSTSKIVGVSICATNDVHVGGNVCATAFFGDGSGLTNVSLSVSSSVAHFTANVLDVPACASITNLVAATGSFTTKVSGVAAEFSGNVCASEYYGDGSNLTNVSAPTSVASMTINTLGVVTAASITSLVAPHGSFTTKVSGVAAEFSGIVSATTFDGALIGDVTGDVTGDIDGATGSFSACISATNLVAATGSFTTKVSGVAGEFSGTVCAATFDGALTGDVTGDIDGATGSFSACISATNLVAATGSFTTKVSGVAAEFSGNVCASEYYGDGSNLTNLPSAPTSVASFTVNQLGVVTAASITSLVAPHGSFTTKVSGVAAEFSGNVCAAEYYGDGSNLSGISSPTSVASFTVNQLGVVTAASITSLVAPHGSFTTKVSGVAAEFSGTVCAATFDGALTGDVTGDIDGATGSFSACISSTNLVAATGSFTTKVSGVAAEFSGNVCAAEFYGGGANITGITAATSVDEYKVNELTVVSIAHVEKGDAGSVTANALADELVIENSDHAGLSILTPNDKHGYVMFGDPDSNSAGQIQYDHATPAWQYIFEGNNRMYFTGTETVFNDGGGDFDFRVEGDTDTTLFTVDAGNDQIVVGGNTIPDSDGTLNLGSAAEEFNKVFMRYPALWERLINVIYVRVVNSGGTMKLAVAEHSWDVGAGGTNLGPSMNTSNTGDFTAPLLDASTGFGGYPAGIWSASKNYIVFDMPDQSNGTNIIGQVFMVKNRMPVTITETGLNAWYACHQRNVGGSNIYRGELILHYGDNALESSTTVYATSNYTDWLAVFYAND